MSKLLLIDLDGTMIDTPHFQAWSNVAHRLAGKQLTQREYIDHIAGRPRMEGASRLLALITDDIGDQRSGSLSADELAQHKQKEFLQLSQGTELFEDAKRLLERIAQAAQPVMFYTASLNAPQLFEAAIERSSLRQESRLSITRQAPGQSREALIQQLVGSRDPQDVELIDDSPYATDLACGLGLHAWQIRRHDLEPKAAHPQASILSSLDEYPLANPSQGRTMNNQSAVLVTGGAGYIGSRLVPKLLAAGYRVRVLDALYFGNGLEGVMNHPALEFIKGDIRDPLLVEQSLRGMHTVVHLAAVANDPSFNSAPELGQSINIDCLPHLMSSAKRLGCRRFIYASSASVYGVNTEPFVDERQPCVPITDYNRFKADGEKILFGLTDASFETVAVRAATVCGWSPRQRLDLTVNILTASALARGEITVFGGSQYRPNVHIGDLTRLYTMLVERESLDEVCGTAINVGYENHTVTEIADQVKQVVDRYFLVNVPITTTRSDDVRSYRLDSRRVQQTLGFEFIYSIRDAIVEICEQWQSGNFNDSDDVLSDTRYHNVRNMLHKDWSFQPSGDTSC